MISILNGLAVVVTITWLFALSLGQLGQTWHMLRGGDRLERFWRACARIHQELWIVAPIGLLSLTIQASADHNWFALFWDIVNCYLWWARRNWPEDNHWKRRAKKAKDAVKEVAGRLVVVPQTGGSS